MRRKNGTGLVRNEERVLCAALSLTKLGEGEFHGYRLVKAFEGTFNKRLAMSTLYRCLTRLESFELIEGEWKFDETVSGRPTRFFTLTREGVKAAEDIGLEFDLVDNQLRLRPSSS